MIVDNAVYRDGQRIDLGQTVGDLTAIGDLNLGGGAFVWVELDDPDEAELRSIAEVFGLHPLAVEDALQAHQRPKLERYDDSVFVVLRSLRYFDAHDAVETGEINVFIGDTFIVTVSHGDGGEVRRARAWIDEHATPAWVGPSAVVYAVCDQVVNQYDVVADGLTVDVDEIEVSVFSPERTDDAKRIYLLKRELAEMRRAVLPLREPIRRLFGGTIETIDEETENYFRDVADHLDRIADITETLDSLLSTAFDAHMAQLSVQQNDDMRTISAAIGMVAIPTLISAIYGMNFQHMPELGWTYGYPVALGLMVISGLAVGWVAKRFGWL